MKKFDHKKDMGSYGEALIVSEIIRHGCAAFTDFGDNSKIDVIVEDSAGKLHRIQIKTVGREGKTPDVSLLYLYKSGPGGYRFTYTSDMLDWFALLDLETQKIAWVPAEVAFTCKTQLSLRHTKSSKNQIKGIRMFDDFTSFPFV